MNCPNCEAVHQPDDNFCAKCGVRLRMAAQAPDAEGPCRGCGSPVPAESRFCGVCGVESPHAIVIAAFRTNGDAAAAGKRGAFASAGPSARTVADAKPAVKQEAGAKPAMGRAPTKPITRAPAPPRTGATAPTPTVGASASPSTTAPAAKRPTTGETPAVKRTGETPLASKPAVAGSTTTATQTIPAASDDAAEPARPSEPAAPKPAGRAPRPKVLVAPEGWPDLTDELAEIRFLVMQGFEEEASANLAELQRRHPGHPDLPRNAGDPSPTATPRPAAKTPVSLTTPAAPPTPEPTPTPADAPPTAAAPTAASTPTAPGTAAVVSASAATQPAPPKKPGALASASTSAAAPASTAGEPRRIAPPAATPPKSGTRPPVRGTTVPPMDALEPASPLSPRSHHPADSAADTLEVDIDATELSELGDIEDPAALSIAGANRSTIALGFDDEHDGETMVDVEFEHLDRTVVSKAPPAAASWDAPPRGETQIGPPPGPPELGSDDDDDDDDDDVQTIALPQLPTTSEGTVIAPAPTGPPAAKPSTPLAPVRTRSEDPENAATIEMRRGDVAPPRTTVIPDGDRKQPPPPAPFGGVPPPGSTLVPGTAPMPGGFPAKASEPEAPKAPSPDDRANSPKRAPVRTEIVEPVPVDGTVVAPAPASTSSASASAVTGRTVPPTSGPNEELAAVRFVMLGTQGEPLAEQVVVPGTSFDIGRGPEAAWNDDEFIEPQHARLTPMRGGVKVEELTPRGAVFRRLSERTPLRDGDQLRVGQSLLVYERAAEEPGAGRFGRVVAHAHPDGIASALPLGEAGLMVGRDIGGVTLPQDTFVSGSHCRFVCNDGGVFIEDLESSNGTYLRLQSGQWVPFDEYLLIGQTQFAIRK